MTDLNKLRSEFEELPEVKQWIERLIYGDNSEVYIMVDETEENNAITTWINGAWFVWKLKAKAQAVPEGCVLVPLEPTQEMLAAANHAPMPMVHIDSISGREKLRISTQYKAMVNVCKSGAEQ